MYTSNKWQVTIIKIIFAQLIGKRVDFTTLSNNSATNDTIFPAIFRWDVCEAQIFIQAGNLYRQLPRSLRPIVS